MTKKRKAVNAPAVIIAPEHQSAPKVPQPSRAELLARINNVGLDKPAATAFEQDLSAPCMVSRDPQANEMQRRMMEQSAQDERLDAKEELHRQEERSRAAVKDYRWDGQERWQGRENEEMRLVRILHAYRFIRELQRAGVKASIYDPYEVYRREGVGIWRWPKSEARLWLNDFTRAGRIGITAWVKGEAKTVTSLQYPYGPEWSIMRFDERDLPTDERYRGWRTALLRLIEEGVLNEAEANRAFGEPYGAASLYYREQLYKHRALTMGLTQRAA